MATAMGVLEKAGKSPFLEQFVATGAALLAEKESMALERVPMNPQCM